ncbi:GFA family protein [Duganella dendranthematis]|jgi:hypothetical protein|uniref:GFA family protein n=1 Tax=Duganella dendranthematis TaxID=2728021 RepID=A0ABX6MC98_9BURK|nr:GFA family protein [Duganella dendranthematis]QJD91958.1 GFA family protein [Duganella dendranthematis]
MKYTGSCHCGNIKFEAEGEIASALACNCSICQRKGSLLWFVPRTQMQLLTPEEHAKAYLFNQHKIAHRFCPHCGIHPYAEATAPDGTPTAAINLRCIEGIDLAAIPVHHHDGRAI